MTVIIHQMNKTPIVSIDIAVKTGSAVEGIYAGSGISHFLEHMMFKNKAEQKGQSYAEKIKALGGNMNAFTSHDFTVYYATVPPEKAAPALEILKNLISNSHFDALELKKEKSVVLDEARKNKDQPGRMASELSWRTAFQEHPYKYPVLGHDGLLERIGKQEMEDYYSKRYSTHRMVLAISGDVNKDELFREVLEKFGPMKRNLIPDLPNVEEPLQISPRERVEYMDISLAHVSLAFRGVSIGDPALYPLDVLALALGAGEDSILTKELRNKKKLVHHISSSNITLRSAGLFYIHFAADEEKVVDAISAVLEELDNIKKRGIPDSDLKKIRNISRANLINGLETVEGRTRDMSISEALTGDHAFSESYIENLALVTSEDIRSAAGDHLIDQHLNIVRILPEIKEEKIAPDSTPRPSSRELSKHDMTNGIRIIICEDHSTPNCSMSAVFLGGVRAENSSNNGVSHLMSSLLLDGTKERSEEEIKSEIESLGGGIHSFSANNSFGIKINLLSGDWKKGIEILSDAVINPVFQQEKMEKERSLILAAIKERDDGIISSGMMRFKENFYKEHPYRMHPLGKAETVNSLDRRDVLGFYNSLCVPANMVIAVCGDIRAAEVTDEVKKHFADFKRDEPVLPDPPTNISKRDKNKFSYEMKREQSMIIIGFPSVKLSDNDRYAFEIVDSVMSGYNGRMYNNVREKLGMGYIVGSSYQPGLEVGCFAFYALSSRKNIDTIKEAMLKEIKDLKENPLPEEELEAAKRFLINQSVSGLQTNSSIDFATSLDELYGLGYKNFELYDEKINNVTVSQIKRAVNQYFDTKNSIIVTVYGETGGEE
ncbi:MAG: insulinase family protein [Candidatus Omnitrophica bacterium]|nr:insulinase family protein [Candidatus Omnitrophota bacterium]